jgi:transcriptional regulator with XRE-family HTH domain
MIGIVKRLEARLMVSGMTKVVLADKVGISRDMLTKMSTNQDVTVGRLVEIAKVLGVRPEWLIFGTGAVEEAPVLSSLMYPNQRHARRLAAEALVPEPLLAKVDAWGGELYSEKSVWYWLAAYLRAAGAPDGPPGPGRKEAEQGQPVGSNVTRLVRKG